MPILPDKLNALLDEQDAKTVRQTALVAPKVSPDDMGRALSIAQRREQPPLVVADNLADFDEREHLDAMEAAGKEPRLGAFLQKPEHAALAKDDLPAMGFLARTITNLFPFVDNPQPRIDRIGEHLKSGFEQAAGGLVQRAVDIAASPFQGLPQASPYAAQTRAGQALGADITDLGQATSAGASAGIRRPATVADALRDPGNTFDYYGGMLAESIPILVAGAGASVGGPGAALAVMGVGTSAQSYGQYRSEGVDPARAGVAADVQGGLEAVFETVPLAAAFKPGTGFVRRFLTTTAAESASEGATQAAQDQAEASLLGRKITPGQRLANIVDAAIVGVGMAGPLAAVGAAREVGNEDRAARRQQVLDGLNKIDRAATDADNLAALTEAASKAKLGQRSPQAMEQLVGDTGTVYVPVEAVRTLYQGDVAAFAQAITGDPDALAAAGEFGDLAIPLAKWASLVAQQPNAAEWAKHGRTQVDGYSAADMEQAGFLEQTLATDEAAARALPADTVAVDRIRDDVLGMLVASDRYRPEDADRQAGLVARMFATMAQRTGQDAWALYEGYNLRINGRGGQPGKPLQLDPRNEALLDAVLTGRMPSDAEVNGPSLLSALVAAGGVQDQGGELTGRDAMKGRPGLVNRNGLPLDTAREAMVEAGYLPEGADINALIDAMDAELRGAPVYSQQNRDPARDAFRNDAIDLQRAFDEAFRDMPADEFAKLSRQDIYDRLFSKPSLFQQFAGKVRELYQAAFHGTPHTVDKFSLQKIGTGEGAQAFGWGLYFTSKRDIAEHYRKTLSDGTSSTGAVFVRGEKVDAFSPEGHAARLLFYNDAREIKASAKQWLKEAKAGEKWAAEISAKAGTSAEDYYQRLNTFLASHKRRDVKIIKGNLYQVDIPEDADLLDYDAPIQKQNAAVQEIARNFLRENGYLREGENGPRQLSSSFREAAMALGGMARGSDGQTLYEMLAKKLGSEQAASIYLHERGVPGMRYKAGQLSGVHSAGVNYVIWDENAISDVRTLYQSARGAKPAAVDQTQTPEFRRWFGDSKVVDAQGRPLVVYHGTGGNFDVFENRPAHGAGGMSARHGFFFSASPLTASEYAEETPDFARTRAYERARRAELRGDWDEARAITEELESPDFTGGMAPNVMPVYLAINNPKIVDFGGRGYNAQTDNLTAIIRDAKAAGHDGVILRNFDDAIRATDPTDHFVAFRPEQIKSATGNSGAFDPNDPSILRQGSASAPRGQLRIGANRSMSIDLLAGADLSTFLHETGHFFLEVMGDLAQRPDAPQQVRDDYAAILAWAGNTGEPLTTEQHEAWAEAFEAYLMEGKAPAAELQSAFSRFRAWLTSIYKAMLQLRVPLTDEVRSVMDRMLASDEEIAAAQGRDAEPLPLPDESRSLLRPGQWEAYVASLEAAGEEARAEVFASLVKAHKRAAEAWYREETARVREQVQAEFEAAPVVRAWRILAGRAQVDGAEVPPELRIRLDRAAIEAMYDAPTAKRMLERLRPLGVYRKAGGVSPDEAASLLGFDSGDALLQGLAEVRNLTARVEAETTARMRERHPDPLTDGSLPEKAMDAVHGAKRVAAIENELGLLAQLANQPRPNRRALAALAERVVVGKRIRDIRPHDYLAGERKAANLAAKAAAQGDYAAALKAKRDQALQAALYSQARKAQEAADSAQRYLKRFTGTKVRARLGKAGADYLEQIDGLLERFDFRQVSGAAADRRARLADWIDRQRADGRDLDLPAKLLDDAFRKPWRELTVEELAGLRDSVKQIAHLADLKNVLLLGNERRDRAAVDAAMAASILAGNAKRPDRTGDETLGDKARRDVLQARAATGAATDIARELDGFADGGAVWDNTVRVIRDAITQQVNPALHSAQEALATLYRQHYTMAELRGLQQRRKVPGVPDAWSRGRILSLALNWGNAGNREAILTQARGRLSPEQVGILLGTLDARDWGFVQGVWKQIDAYWPDIAAAERRRKGLVPEKVEAAPFAVTTSDGKTLQIPGGYYPLKYEIDTAKAMREEADSFYDAIRTGRFAKAATKDGHTIERVGSGGRSVRLDLGVAETHLRDVIRDLHLGDAVNYVHQALHGPAFNQAVSDTGTVELVRAMETWLRDVASGEIGLRTRAEKTLRAVRVNFTAAVLTWKFVSAALQITGIVQTSVVLGKKHMLDGVQRYARRPVAMGRYINEASPFMAQRVFSHVEAVQQVMDAKGSRYAAGRSAMIRWGYWMMGRVQRLVDAATWLGAEARGMELFDGDVAKARAHADDVVARAQGSGEFVDKNPLQRGTIGDTVRQSEYIRATTALMGYMIAKSNAAYARTKVTNFRSFREGVKWAGDMANLFVVEALIVAIIRGQMPGDDDEDGSTVDDWLAMAAKEGASNLFGGIPGISQAVSELRGYDAKGIVSSAWESVGKAIEQAKQGELDKAAVKSGVTLAGFATGLPSSQINKTIDAIAAKQDGQDLNAYDYIAGPPKD